MSRDDNEPKKGKGFIKGAGRVVALPVTVPFRSMVRSVSLAKQSFKRTTDSVVIVKDYGSKAFSNVKNAGQRGANDSFESLFSGKEGGELLRRNLRRFLLRKRAAISMLFLFTLYGMGSVILFHQFYGLLTFVGGVMFGVTLCFESQFRIWQLRNRRLSVEEKGSVTNFLSESPLLDMFKPELFGSAKSD